MNRMPTPALTMVLPPKNHSRIDASQSRRGAGAALGAGGRNDVSGGALTALPIASIGIATAACVAAGSDDALRTRAAASTPASWPGTLVASFVSARVVAEVAASDLSANWLAGSTPRFAIDCRNSAISRCWDHDRSSSQATAPPSNTPPPSLHAAPSIPPITIAMMVRTPTPSKTCSFHSSSRPRGGSRQHAGIAACDPKARRMGPTEGRRVLRVGAAGWRSGVSPRAGQPPSRRCVRAGNCRRTDAMRAASRSASTTPSPSVCTATT